MSKLAKRKRSLEILTILTAVVGTIVGVGIYVKNDNQPGHVLGDVGNPIVALILWAFVGLVAFLMMVFFLEITSSTIKSGNGTISTWMKLFVGRRAASAVSIYYVFVYLPVNYGFFATIIVSYILEAANNPVTNSWALFGIYLSFGALFIVFFSMINAFLRNFSKIFQIVGTIVKLIPLFLVLLAIFIPDKTWGVFFQNADQIQEVVGDNGGNTWSTSLENVDGMRIFSGFAPILFAFNGFISAANLQSESKDKAMVGRVILIGVGFSAIFYVLITLSLFLGSKDGSVVSFFEYMLNGFKSTPPGEESKGVSVLVGNLVLAVVCLISINSYTLLGPTFLHNDVKEGILFSNNKRISLVKAAVFQMIIGLLFFIVLLALGIFRSSRNPGYYFDQTSNAGAIIGFTFYIVLMIGGCVNRRTHKVSVVKLKNWIFWTSGIFSLVSLIFMIGYSYIDFFILSSIPGEHRDLAKPVSMLASLLGVAIIWVVNEIMLKKVPFNPEEMNMTFPIPKEKRFVWVKKDSKIKKENQTNKSSKKMKKVPNLPKDEV